MADMDGTNATVIVPDVDADFLTVDREGDSLFWVQDDPKGNTSFGIFKSKLDGQQGGISIKLDLRVVPIKFRIASDHIFFSDNLYNAQLNTYNKSTTGSVMQEYGNLTGFSPQSKEDFYVYYPKYREQERKSPCDDGSCSQICVPKLKGSKSCLCSAGFYLLPDTHNCSSKLFLKY